jgi:predicted 3-demethylubiquinone-9 3-methyltransferase (glyoxalase superfamily)
MTVDFELDGQPFTALNGGPLFQFNEAVSFQINGADQKFGVSWQVVPTALARMFDDPKNPGSQRAMQALLQMRKIDVNQLERAFAGA